MPSGSARQDDVTRPAFGGTAGGLSGADCGRSGLCRPSRWALGPFGFPVVTRACDDSTFEGRLENPEQWFRDRVDAGAGVEQHPGVDVVRKSHSTAEGKPTAAASRAAMGTVKTSRKRTGLGRPLPPSVRRLICRQHPRQETCDVLWRSFSCGCRQREASNPAPQPK